MQIVIQASVRVLIQGTRSCVGQQVDGNRDEEVGEEEE